MRRSILLAATAGALILPAGAGAHVSLHPNTLPAGSNPTIDVRVPNEDNRATVDNVDMQVPPGFIDVSPETPAGWRATIRTTKLAKPVQTDDGAVTEEVSEIIWSAPKGHGIAPGSFLNFPILTAIPDGDAGTTLTFKVLQTYSNGSVVRWIEPANSTMHPAPTVNVTAAGGQLEDVAGTEAGPPAAGGASPAPATPTTTTKSTGASKGLAIAALVIGALGLVIGLTALASARRRSGETA
jgi:uncharacterized protein YcnI